MFYTFSLLLYTRAKPPPVLSDLFAIEILFPSLLSIEHATHTLSSSLFFSHVSNITQTSIALLTMYSCSTYSLFLMDCILIELIITFSDGWDFVFVSHMWISMMF